MIGASDMIKPPITGELLQRSSQRKKTRKTFGDDFLDLNLTQINGYNNKKQRTYNRNCAFCRTSGELIFCKFCKCKAHAKCFRDNRGWVRKGYKNYNAICFDCRPCDMCNQHEGKLHYCFKCKCSYHAMCDDKLSVQFANTKGDNWQCSLCDKIGMVGGESLNESEWVKEVQRRRAIKQREMFGKALKCLPVCSYQNDEPMIDEEEAATMDITVQSDLEINTRSCNSSQVLSPAIVLPDQRDNADKSLFSNQRTNTGVGADERSAISLERIESASTNQNKVTSGAHVGVGNAIETPFEMNRSNSDRLPESESVTLFGDRNQRVRTSGVSIVQSGSFGQIISTEQNCDISASSVSVEQIEIGSSVEIGQLADSNEFDTQSSSNLVVVGQDQSSVNSVQRSPFTSNENTCDDLLSQSSSERFPIINGSCRPADEHPYACSQRHAVTISTSATSTTITINTSSANSISGSGSSASIKSTSTNSSKRGELLQRSDSIRTTERPKQRSRQEIMNHYFCRNNGTELLKQKLFRKACRSQVSVLSPQNWSVDDVADYIKEVGFERESELFRAVKVNGKLLMSFNRNQIVNELGLKLGPAIKLYAYIHDLQEKNRSPDHATSK